MEKILASICIAIMLGVIAMLIPIPIMTFTQVVVTKGYDQEASPQENNFTTTRMQTPLEAAQTYGKMDVGPVPFPSSLVHVTSIVATSFVAALVTLFFFKRKIKLI